MGRSENNEAVQKIIWMVASLRSQIIWIATILLSQNLAMTENNALDSANRRILRKNRRILRQNLKQILRNIRFCEFRRI
ncbi:hypothetical protein ACWIUD_11095 [Helicobacter sp. 23-1044]